MAQQYISDAGTLIIPGGYSTIKVATDHSGLATTGVLMLVGEADAGPDYSAETSLAANAFGPDEIASVLAKYKSGNLVDGFRAASAPANDPDIVGSPSAIILVKTNPSTKAKTTLLKWDASSYSDLADQSYGKLGNLIYVSVAAKTSETVPTTGSMTWIPNVGTVNADLRANGGSALALALSANTDPAAFVAAVDALANIDATGGALRTVLPSISGTLAIAATGNNVVVTYSGVFNTVPSVGDTLVIPTGSVIAGGANQNVGAYVITGATTNTVSATKLSDAGKGGAVAGVITAPLTVTAQTVVATTDIKGYAPVVIKLTAANPSDGLGKALEISELTTGVDLLSRCLYALNTAVVTFVSKTGAAKQLVSASEYSATLSATRQVDSITETLSAGGEIALKIGYQGTTASVVIDDVNLVASATGGSGAGFSIALKDFPTLSDLASYIGSKTGWKCSVGTAALGQLPSTALDNGTFTCASTWGESPGRIKIDGYRFFNKIKNESVLLQLQDTASAVVQQAGAGIPAPTTGVAYLSGGTKGATTDAIVTAAVDALEKVRGNFLIPLFSRDATTDIADALTESGSSYTIDAVNAYVRTHALKMSTLKRRRNRQAFLSKKDTFANCKNASANIASFRCAMTFQDVKNTASDGSLAQFQSWMGACVAAGMQAAGFYRAIVHKTANISGALQAAKDFDDQDTSQMEEALLAGLLPLIKSETGGYHWVSDQTTYGKDANFVFNSVQAVYVADIIALTTAQRMENAFVGQSVADISAPLALGFLETVMEDFLRLKLIAPSDDAPKGFKNASIRISGTAMIVSLEVKLAGAIYFVPVSFLVSQVQQSA